MLPRIRPETEQSNGHVRYTGVWSTRQLGTVTTTQIAYEEQLPKKWEPKNTYENIFTFLFLAFFELCCALALLLLGIYHWSDDQETYDPGFASLLTVTGIAATWVALFTVFAFWLGKSGRVAKRVVIIFSVVALYLLVQEIQAISLIIAPKAYVGAPISGFYIAEISLASLISILILISLYPASDALISNDLHPRVGARAISLFLNTVVGAEIVVYLCFGIYGIRNSFEGAATRVEVTLLLSTASVPINSLLLLATLGTYYALGRKKRPNVLPYAVVGIVALIMYLNSVQLYVAFFNNGLQHDWRDNAFVAMFALNWLSMFGVAVMVTSAVAFAYK